MNTQQQSQIIEISLLKWVSLLIRKTVKSFQQLSTGQFYIQLLSQVRQFKFIKPLKEIVQTQQQSFNLMNRISNMKIIGDSILRYYQTHLMRDVYGVKIDYVQLCMGNRSESIKLFSLVIGVIGQSESNKEFKKIFQAIDNLQPEDQDIVKALLQNSRNIGECIIKKQDSPYQKKILTKMEIYQDKIQSLQQQLSNLREEIQEEKLSNQSLLKQVKELKSQKSKLIQKAQVLELLNTRLQSQNSSFLLENQNLVKKLQSQRRHYDMMSINNQQTLVNYEKQMSVVNLMKDKIQQLKSANNELKQNISEILKQNSEKQAKFIMMKQNYKSLQQNYMKTLEKLTEAQLEYQNFKFQQQKCSDMKGTAKLPSSPAYHISNNSQLSSINYRVRDRLGSFIKGQLSHVQMVDSNFVQRQRETSGSKFKKSTFNNQQCLMSSHLQNFSHFAMNSMVKNGDLRDIEDVSEFEGEYSYEGNKINENQLDKSILIDEQQQIQMRNSQKKLQNLQKINEKKDIDGPQIKGPNFDEQNLMINMIEKLFNQNLQLKSQLQKYDILKNKKQQRLQIFRQKLSKIRQVESIADINAKLQQQKENINQNGFPIFLMTEKQSQNKKDNFKESTQDSSQRYSYYPLVLN